MRQRRKIQVSLYVQSGSNIDMKIPINEQRKEDERSLAIYRELKERAERILNDREGVEDAGKLIAQYDGDPLLALAFGEDSSIVDLDESLRLDPLKVRQLNIVGIKDLGRI